jgi:hypothetical protein
MNLRPELLFPPLDEARVARLARLAARIDGAHPGQWEEDLEEFNRGAGTNLAFADFQGVYGGQDHDTWVRSVLAEPFQKPIADITRDEFLELIRRVSAALGKEHEIAFWLGLLEANLPGRRISDLIFWPGDYFGDGDNSRELTPEQILDIAQAAPGNAARGRH